MNPSRKLSTETGQVQGLPDVRILHPIFQWNIGWWGKGLWATEDMLTLQRRVQEILVPGWNPDDRSDWKKWVNTNCDVLTVWSHIWHQTAVLLTRDEAILGKQDALAPLGARVEHPATFAGRL